MRTSQNALELLQQRLKDVDNSVDSRELEQLANAIAAISKLETTDDILNISDVKLAKLLESSALKFNDISDYSSEKLSELSNIRTEKLSEIETSKQSGINMILDAAEEKVAEIDLIVDRFGATNDIPENSTICTEISKKLDQHKFLQQSDLPFIFGILSRYDDYWGVGGFTTALGTWSTTGADIMLSLPTGCHNYTTQNAGFYLEPKLCFLQGIHGNFIKKKSYLKYQCSTSQYQYPYAALGCLFVKNCSEIDITSTITFGGTSYSASYAGASMFIGIPDYDNEIVVWTNAYSYSSSSYSVSGTATFVVPGNMTVCVLLYTSSYYITSLSSYYYQAQFLEWRLNKIRSEFLVNNLEIDFEKTIKAWQYPGCLTTFDIFR